MQYKTYTDEEIKDFIKQHAHAVLGVTHEAVLKYIESSVPEANSLEAIGKLDPVKFQLLIADVTGNEIQKLLPDANFATLLKMSSAMAQSYIEGMKAATLSRVMSLMQQMMEQNKQNKQTEQDSEAKAPQPPRMDASGLN